MTKPKTKIKNAQKRSSLSKSDLNFQKKVNWAPNPKMTNNDKKAENDCIQLNKAKIDLKLLDLPKATKFNRKHQIWLKQTKTNLKSRPNSNESVRVHPNRLKITQSYLGKVRKTCSRRRVRTRKMPKIQLTRKAKNELIYQFFRTGLRIPSLCQPCSKCQLQCYKFWVLPVLGAVFWLPMSTSL